jgi:hypothetical protein
METGLNTVANYLSTIRVQSSFKNVIKDKFLKPEMIITERMSKIKMGIIAILIISFITSNVYAENKNNRIIFDKEGSPQVVPVNYTYANYGGEPAFCIIANADKYRLNNGQEFNLSLFLTGAGDVNFSKLRINIPSSLVKDNIVRYLVIDQSLTKVPNDIVTKPMITSLKLPPYAVLSLNSLDFLWYANLNNSFVNYGEMLLGEQTPLSLNFTIPQNATSGDYNIYIDLFYKDKDKWYSDTQVVPLHINAWYEEDWVKLLLIIPFISIILQILNIWLTNKRITSDAEKQDNKEVVQTSVEKKDTSD